MTSNKVKDRIRISQAFLPSTGVDLFNAVVLEQHGRTIEACSPRAECALVPRLHHLGRRPCQPCSGISKHDWLCGGGARAAGRLDTACIPTLLGHGNARGGKRDQHRRDGTDEGWTCYCCRWNEGSHLCHRVGVGRSEVVDVDGENMIAAPSVAHLPVVAIAARVAVYRYRQL
nr:hypothetical protein CFP56_56065 [Quercus suber]